MVVGFKDMNTHSETALMPALSQQLVLFDIGKDVWTSVLATKVSCSGDEINESHYLDGSSL